MERDTTIYRFTLVFTIDAYVLSGLIHPEASREYGIAPVSSFASLQHRRWCIFFFRQMIQLLKRKHDLLRESRFTALATAALIPSMTGMAHPNRFDVATIKSAQATHNVALELNPQSAFWRAATPISFDGDNYGRPIRQLRTEVRSRWTEDSLYLLFTCPYHTLNLKPSPQTKRETNHLWNWDVVEVFIGSDFENIRRYKEFELSPQGEWVDLAIDLDLPHPADGWIWNSGFETSARIDSEKKIWYGAMRIPFASIVPQTPRVGSVLRVNFFRSQGASPNQHLLAWQAPMGESFHVPERFGQLELLK